jgi:membrane protease YdiL (CAAX protease family)
MTEFSAPDIVFAFLVSLAILVLLGIVSVWYAVLWRLYTERGFPELDRLVPGGRVRWGIGTIILALGLYAAVNIGTQWAYLRANGRLPARPPAAHVAVAPAKPPGSGPALAKHEPELLTKTEGMFLVAVANSISIVALPLLLRLTSGSRLLDLGISLDDWPRQVRVGFLATLFVCPLVYLVQFQVLRIWPMKEDTEHPVQVMLLEQFTPGVAYLAALCAVVMAPLFEELFFRALFQGWLAERLARLRPPATPRASTAYSPPDFDEGLDSAFTAPPEPAVLFIADPPVTKSPGDSESLELSRSRSWLAVVLTSLFFGLVHFPQWPAPISIFVLSLAFGAVYQRTGSLIASICMHATFNGISTLMLLAGIMGGQLQDSKKQHNAPPEPAKAAVATLRGEASNVAPAGREM